MTQRDKMRELYQQHSGNKEAVIEAYAKAEQAGEVNRQRNASVYGTKQYAQALWNDGEKKAWLVQNKPVQSVREVLSQPVSTAFPHEQVPQAEVQKEILSQPALEATNRKLRKFDHAPKRVIELYEEAVKAMNMEMSVSCAAVLRTMIEAICVDKGIVEGVVDKTFFNRFTRSSNLQGKIEGLREAGLITESHAVVLHQIRFLGNDAVHRAEAVETTLLEVAVEIVENLVYQVYELPHKAGKFPSKAKQP